MLSLYTQNESGTCSNGDPWDNLDDSSFHTDVNEIISSSPIVQTPLTNKHKVSSIYKMLYSYHENWPLNILLP